MSDAKLSKLAERAAEETFLTEIASIIDPAAFSHKYAPTLVADHEKWLTNKSRRIRKAIFKADQVFDAFQALRAALSEARWYVNDALEAHEHSDGRELLERIDTALTRLPETVQ